MTFVNIARMQINALFVAYRPTKPVPVPVKVSWLLIKTYNALCTVQWETCDHDLQQYEFLGANYARQQSGLLESSCCRTTKTLSSTLWNARVMVWLCPGWRSRGYRSTWTLSASDDSPSYTETHVATIHNEQNTAHHNKNTLNCG